MNDVSITPFDKTYCEEYIELEFNPDVKKYVGGIPRKSKQVMRREINRGDYQGTGIYAIVENSTGSFVGRCGFIEKDEEKEIYILIAKRHWGKKYAKPAIRELLKITERKNIVAIIDPDNTKSIKLFHSLCFKEIGKVITNNWQDKHIKFKLQNA